MNPTNSTLSALLRRAHGLTFFLVAAITFGIYLFIPQATWAANADYLSSAPGSTPQSRTLLNQFAVPLEITAYDNTDFPVPDVTVTFVAPGSGASGVFDNGQTTIVLTTDFSGNASTTFTANASAGSYQVIATATGGTNPTAAFNLTNTVAPGTPNSATPAANTTPQSVPLSTIARYPLSVRILDSVGIAVPNTTVRFVAPENGASGIFANSQSTIDLNTDVNGLATTTFTTNATAGSYNVTATAINAVLVPHPAASFSLTNYVNSPATAADSNNSSPQRAVLGAAYTLPLSTLISDSNGYPVSNTTVRFVAPGSGASGVFSNSTTTIDVVTNASGIASASFTANAIAGTYSVSASALQGATPSVSFTLSNYVPLQGPQYPPPGTLTFDPGTTADGAIGKTGGKSWSYSAVSLANTDTVYWGALDKMIKLSFIDSSYSRTGEVLTYQPTLSDLPNGKAVWSGHTTVGSTLAYTRFTLKTTANDGTTPLPLTDAFSLGLPTDVGALLKVTAGLQYKANLYFEASLSESSGFDPAYDFYNYYHQLYQQTASAAYSSVDFGFYWENTPPTITPIANQLIQKNGNGGPYSFTIGDNETIPANLIVTATSGNTTLLPNNAITLSGSDADRTISVAPVAGQTGTSLITVTVSDSVVSTSTTFTLTVNAPPTISALSDQLVQQDTTGGPYAVTIGDNETPAGSLQLSATSTNTTLLPNNAITFGGSGASRTVSVTPASGQHGTTTVTVTVTDSAFATASSSFVLTVNAPPKLNFNGPLTVDAGSTGTITNTLLQASDAESPVSQITFTLAGTTHNGTLKLGSTTLTGGSSFTMQNINSNLLTYTPDAATCATSDDFQFSVTDGNGGMYKDGQYTSFTFPITINHPNRAPTVPLSTNLSVPLGNTYTGTLSASDPDAACITPTFTFSIVTGASHGTATITNAATGAFTYTPNQGYEGSDSFSYSVSDGQASSGQGTVNLTVANQAPVANNASGTTGEGVALTGTLHATDPDLPAQALSYAITSNGSKGTAAVTNAATGAFSYTPNANAIGSDTFTFTANDGTLTSTPATFTVTIKPVLKAGDLLVTNQKQQQGNGPAPTLVVVRPQNGHQAVISSGDKFIDLYGVTVEQDGNILVLDGTNGLLRVNPQSGAQSVVTSAATISGMAIGLTTEANGNILVGSTKGLHRIDQSTGQILNTFEMGSLTFPAGVVVAPDGQIYVTDVGAIAQQISQLVKIDPISGSQNVLASGGNLMVPSSLVLTSLGDIFITDGPMGPVNNILLAPASDYSKEAIFTSGEKLSNPSALAMLNGNLAVVSSGSKEVVLVNTSDAGQSIIASGEYLLNPFGIAVITTPPTISSFANQLVQQNSTGGPYDFTIGDAETVAAALGLSATSSNTTLLPNNAISFGGSGASRTISVTPANGQHGTTVVTVTVFDGQYSASSSFTLTVNAPPKLNFNGPLTVSARSTATITNTLLQATDPDGSASQITFTLDGAPHVGTLKLGSTTLSAGATFTMQDINNNLLSYVAANSCDTSDDFQYSVRDGNGGQYFDGQYSSFTFPITISHPNQAPTVPAKTTIGAPLGNTYTGTLPASDPDAACITPTLTFRIVSAPVNGIVTITNAATGAFTYTPDQGFAGKDTFTYTVNDGSVDATPGQVVMTVANQAPVSTNASGTTAEGVVLNGTLHASDPDLPAQTLTYAIATNGNKGTAVITNAATGTFTYTPNTNAIGDDAFTFTASDGSLTSATATFNIRIRPVVKVGDVIISNQKVTNGVSPNLVCFRPQNGHQAVISTGDKFTDLYGVALEKSGTILVLDSANGLLRVDPQTGTQTVVTSAAPFGMAIGLAVEPGGTILVGSQNGLFRIDPVSGQTLTTFSGNDLDFPAGVTVGADGQIYVGDVGAFAKKPSQIIKIDPVSGVQTVLSTGGTLVVPAGLVVNSTGDVFAADGPMGTNNIIEVSQALVQSTFATGNNLSSPAGIALLNGNFVVTNSGNNKLVQVSSADGSQAVLATDGYLLKPFGVAVVALDPPVAQTATNITGTGFTANWSSVPAATGYRLDVATDATFNNMVASLGNVDLGNTTSHDVGSLSAGTYYYRVRAYNAFGQSSSSNTITVITNATLTVTILPANTGSNTVTSIPVGISCHTGSSAGCTADFVGGPSVTLSATNAWNYLQPTWSGDCTQSPCTVTMDQSKNVTATFAENLTVKLLGTPASYYSTLAGAYAAVGTGSSATIQAQVFTYHEQLTFGSPVTVVLDGGNDNNFASTTGYTTVMGTVKVKAGKVIGNRIKIQ